MTWSDPLEFHENYPVFENRTFGAAQPQKYIDIAILSQMRVFCLQINIINVTVWNCASLQLA